VGNVEEVVGPAKDRGTRVLAACPCTDAATVEAGPASWAFLVVVGSPRTFLAMTVGAVVACFHDLKIDIDP
jgi:hypothetical protein